MTSDSSSADMPLATFTVARYCVCTTCRSLPKEEDDMRAAEVLQGLKGIVGSQ